MFNPNFPNSAQNHAKVSILCFLNGLLFEKSRLEKSAQQASKMTAIDCFLYLFALSCNSVENMQLFNRSNSPLGRYDIRQVACFMLRCVESLRKPMCNNEFPTMETDTAFMVKNRDAGATL